MQCAILGVENIKSVLDARLNPKDGTPLQKQLPTKYSLTAMNHGIIKIKNNILIKLENLEILRNSSILYSKRKLGTHRIQIYQQTLHFLQTL